MPRYGKRGVAQQITGLHSGWVCDFCGQLLLVHRVFHDGVDIAVIFHGCPRPAVETWSVAVKLPTPADCKPSTVAALHRLRPRSRCPRQVNTTTVINTGVVTGA